MVFQYGEQLNELYYRPDFVGRISRVVIVSPQTCYEHIKDPFGPPHKKIAKDLPPRIRLRFFAKKQVRVKYFKVKTYRPYYYNASRL